MSMAYKYCNTKGVDILNNLELLVRPPNQFNDPFEFTPRIIAQNPNRKTKELLKSTEYIEFLHTRWRAHGRFNGSLREFRKYVRAHRREMANEMLPEFPLAIAQAQRGVLDEVSKTYGVLCFSNRRDSILMWGHYCDKHCGLVVGFDESNAVFHPTNGRELRPVNYVRERVVFDATWKDSDPRLLSFELSMVFSKNEDWRYEGEMRQLLQLFPLRKELLDDGSLGYFLPIPPSAFVSVTLGAKCSVELEEKVRSALTQPGLSHVTLDHAVLHDSEFALRFV